VEIRNRSIVVTGGGNGIGAALARRFAAEGARGVVVADIDGDAASAVAADIRGLGVETDVSDESAIQRLVSEACAAYGHIDLFCSNAGIGTRGGLEIPNDGWQQMWEVNLMAHVYAARAVLPSMLERGEGYLLQTSSAAGLLTSLGGGAYSVTKHAAVALAEWIAITYGDQGIKVSALCPEFVNTAMLDVPDVEPTVMAWVRAMAIEPEDVAEAVVQGLAEERFLILPHPEVGEFFRRKASDYDRWLDGMRRLQRQIESAAAPVSPDEAQ
jgi:NAD(P)-dependent dehydrogenase (short-subunit alcohol dehydrogenase family)